MGLVGLAMTIFCGPRNVMQDKNCKSLDGLQSVRTVMLHNNIVSLLLSKVCVFLVCVCFCVCYKYR